MIIALGWLSGLLMIIRFALASPGDRLPEFSDCVRACEVALQCADSSSVAVSNPFNNEQFSEPALMYKLLLWDCTSDCDYQCQQIVTEIRDKRGEEIYQFHGKWPFKRVLGIQELYSTVFSIANFVPHYKGFQLLSKALGKSSKSDKTRSLLQNYQFIAVAGMLAWICSSVFHTRDLIITEKLDYFFAGATVLAGFHAVFYRVLRLDMHPRIGKLFTAFTFVIFSGHILRLYLDWSYTYNMRFNIFFGLLQYVMLITVAILNYQRLSTSRAHLIYDLTIVPIGLVVFTGVAMSSELFDFFNYDWQIDSHAIWHALTVLPSFYLYRFFLKDYNFLSSKSVVNIKDT